MQPNDTLLFRALRLNAAFSGTSAILLALTAPWVAAQLGLPGPAPVYVTALLLAGFALQLANIVRTGAIREWEIRGIIAGDLAWVIGSAVLAAIYYKSLTFSGLLLVDVVALAVLCFAIQQIRGLKELRHGTSA